MEEKRECELISTNEVNKAILHLNFANRRMFFAVLAVCITAIVISIGSILIFVQSYTARERNWQETFRELVNRIEVSDGQTGD